MRPLFPGMDPWLELPALWLDVHNSLITAIRDDLASKVAPRYFVGVEQHTYLTSAAGDRAVIRPDITISAGPDRGSAVRRPARPSRGGRDRRGPREMDVEVPIQDRVDEWYLEIRTAGIGKLVTVIEVLSPTNKSAGPGRKTVPTQAEQGPRIEDEPGRDRPAPRRQADAARRTDPVESDYRILVSPGRTRPRAELYAFGVPPSDPGDPDPAAAEGPRAIARRWAPCCMACTSGRGSTWCWITPGPPYPRWKRKTPPGRGRSSRAGSAPFEATRDRNRDASRRVPVERPSPT